MKTQWTQNKLHTIHVIDDHKCTISKTVLNKCKCGGGVCLIVFSNRVRLEIGINSGRFVEIYNGKEQAWKPLGGHAHTF